MTARDVDLTEWTFEDEYSRLIDIQEGAARLVLSEIEDHLSGDYPYFVGINHDGRLEFSFSPIDDLENFKFKTDLSNLFLSEFDAEDRSADEITQCVAQLRKIADTLEIELAKVKTKVTG